MTMTQAAMAPAQCRSHRKSMLRAIFASMLSCLVAAVCCVPVRADAHAPIVVRNQDEYRKAAADLKPGDKVILANGEWRNFEIVFSGRGTPDNPVSLSAETPGKVIVTGLSSLRISGAHVLVSGLVFRDGHSPTGEVISFRTAKGDLATDSRIAGIVIDRFNRPDRQQTDYWVGLHGTRNRFDHSSLIGKTNAGVTLAVVLDEEGSRENDRNEDGSQFHRQAPAIGSGFQQRSRSVPAVRRYRGDRRRTRASRPACPDIHSCRWPLRARRSWQWRALTRAPPTARFRRRPRDPAGGRRPRPWPALFQRASSS